jgi:RNA polymerase sigma-70 factor (ECF subfamily)
MSNVAAVKIPATSFPVPDDNPLRSCKLPEPKRRVVWMSRPSDENPAAVHAEWLDLIAREKDKVAFANLFAWYAPRLKSVMLRQGVEHMLADEQVQEAMLAVWRKSHLFDPNKSTPSTWIFTIARNLRIDRFRKENRPELDPHDPMLSPVSEKPADEAVEEKDRQRLVQECLATLPSEQREVISLSFMEGLTHSEIAERLDLPLGTVKSRLRLSFEKLKPMLRTLQ